MRNNPINDFKISTSDLGFIGKDLQRPECILAEKNGTLWCSDSRGGVVKILPDGTQSLITSRTSIDKDVLNGKDLPNGMCFTKDGDFLIANFGKNCLEMMNRDGQRKILYDNIDGMPIGKVNFVIRDSKDRIWITVSTKHDHWIDVFKPSINDGYIALIDGNKVRIVADGFSITNEIRFDSKEEYLYISETCGRRINRMRILSDGSLAHREVYGPSDLGPGGYPDGIAFDSFGNLWGTLVFGEKIFAITPDGELKIIFDDGNPAAIKKIDAAFFAENVTEELLLSGLSRVAPVMTSITFGGGDLKTVYIGNILGTSISYFRSPIAGKAPLWW